MGLVSQTLANAEGIMMSPRSEQMLNYFVWDWSCKRWTNADGIMTTPPSEQMLNYLVWDWSNNAELMLKEK